MGISKLHAGLENEIACHRGDLDELQRQIAQAKNLIERLPEMLERTSRLEEVIEAAEPLIKFRNPDWQSASVKPKLRRHGIKERDRKLLDRISNSIGNKLATTRSAVWSGRFAKTSRNAK